MRRAEGLCVARLKGGDPALFGELRVDLEAVRARGLDYELVPGVSAVTAAAAALGCEIAGAGAPLLLVAAGDRVDVPAGGVVAVLNAGGDRAALAADLAAHGWPGSTACAVVVGVTRPGEIVLTCRLEELAEALADYGSRGLTTVLVGPVLAARVPPPDRNPDGPRPLGVEALDVWHPLVYVRA